MINSPRDIPKPVSTIPPCFTFPASWKIWVPRDRPTPRDLYEPAPSAKTAGTLAKVSTLLITVGLPKRPAIAGSGGLERTTPRLPSMLSSMAVSSPHTYDPPPTRILISNECVEPRRLLPSTPNSRAIRIAAESFAMAAGYSERMYTKPSCAPTAMAAMAMPSIKVKGSPSIKIRSAKVPLSPSSALQQIYLTSPVVSNTVFHLMPAGKPAPPLPRNPDSVISATICSPVMARARCRPTQPPCA